MMETHEVLRILQERRSAGTTASTRSDPHRVVLVVEGGGMRGVYSGGMVLALEEAGFGDAFDAVYGTSAGALNGAWFLTRNAADAMFTWWDPQVTSRTLTPMGMLTRGRMFNTDHLVHDIYINVAPMDFDGVLAHPTTFHPIATSLRTGLATDLHPELLDATRLQAALRATCELPVIGGPPVEVNGTRYLDGGLAESVPLFTALASGATHALVLRTRRADDPGQTSLVEQVLAGGYLGARAPRTRAAWRERRVRAELLERTALDQGARVLQLRPPLGSPVVGSTERGEALLKEAFEVGRSTAAAALPPLAASA